MNIFKNVLLHHHPHPHPYCQGWLIGLVTSLPLSVDELLPNTTNK